MDYPVYIVHGINPKTNRKNKRIIYALDEEYAKREMESEGFVEPFEIALQQEPPATVKQIDYARNLGIPIPMDATVGEMSRRISAVVDNDVDLSQFYPIVGRGWEGWPAYLHNEESQLMRQARAKSAQCKPIQLSKINNAAIFSPSNFDGRYIATLENCHCLDFYRTGKPCKHMYRLAHELGAYDLSVIPETHVNNEINHNQQEFSSPSQMPPHPQHSVALHVVLLLFTAGIGNIIYAMHISNKQKQWREKYAK